MREDKLVNKTIECMNIILDRYGFRGDIETNGDEITIYFCSDKYQYMLSNKSFVVRPLKDDENYFDYSNVEDFINNED